MRHVSERNSVPAYPMGQSAVSPKKIFAHKGTGSRFWSHFVGQRQRLVGISGLIIHDGGTKCVCHRCGEREGFLGNGVDLRIEKFRS